MSSRRFYYYYKNKTQVLDTDIKHRVVKPVSLMINFILSSLSLFEKTREVNKDLAERQSETFSDRPIKMFLTFILSEDRPIK